MDKVLTVKKPIIGVEQYPRGLRQPMTVAEKAAEKKIQSRLNIINAKILNYIKHRIGVIKAVNDNVFEPDDFDLDIYDETPSDSNNDYSLLGIMGLGMLWSMARLRQTLKTRNIQTNNLIQKLGINVGVVPSDQVLLGIIRDRKNGIAKILERTTVEKLDKILSQGIQNGDSFATISQNISTGLGFDKVRAERIARTETNWALNEGQRQYMESLGVTEYIVVMADDACSDCRDEFENQVFDISVSEELPYHVNCRCVMDAVIPNEWFEQA